MVFEVVRVVEGTPELSKFAALGSLNSECGGDRFSLTGFFVTLAASGGIIEGGGMGFANVCRRRFALFFFLTTFVFVLSSSVSSLLYLMHR